METTQVSIYGWMDKETFCVCEGCVCVWNNIIQP